MGRDLISRRDFVKAGLWTGGAVALVGATGLAGQAYLRYRNGPTDEAWHSFSGGSGPAVYMARDISPQGLQRVYDALDFKLEGSVAAKLSTGEPGGNNFLQPGLIGGLVRGLGATIVECNTAYGGERGDTAEHRRIAEAHGFAAIADIDIMDADGSVALPVRGGAHLTRNLVGSHFERYGSFVSLAHFKGHQMGGYGGAIKNISIGIASVAGKCLIHSAGGQSDHFTMFTPQNEFLESMAEAAKSVSDSLSGRICYVNVMNRLSVDCDCVSHPAEPEMADIGILASMDPVALDQACIDLVFQAGDGEALVQRIESRNGRHVLAHAESIGLGSRSYQLTELDAG